MSGMQGFYYGGYPWKDWGILTAADLNAAIAYAIQSGTESGGGAGSILPGTITNDKLATPWVMIGSTQIILGQTGYTQITGMADPINASDIANKHYVDTAVAAGGGGGGSIGGQKAVPNSGDIVAVAGGHAIQALLIVPAASLLVLNVVAPPSPNDLDVFEISTSQYIDNLTVSALGSFIQNGAVGSLGAGGGRSWRFLQADNTWYGRY